MSSPVRIQYASRLFINAATCIQQKLIPAPKAKYLVLAGNCVAANYAVTQPFLAYASSLWEKVFIVPGTLEHSDLTRQNVCWQTQAETLRKQAMNFKNVYICEHSIHRLPEFTLIATPLGGAFLGNPAELIAADPPLEHLNASGGNVLRKMRFINEEDLGFLQEALSQESASKKPLVVATYQLPIIHLIGEKKSDELFNGTVSPYAFTGTVSILPPKLQQTILSNNIPLKAWIAGASDESMQLLGTSRHKTIFTTNPSTSSNYNPQKTIELA
jgi:hypothetical protein